MYGFNILEPVEITDAVLTFSNAEEDAPAWDDATTWSLGDVVDHVGRLWEALQANTAHEPPEGADGDDYWVDTGPNNIRAMFDGAIQSQTVQEDEVVVELTMPAGSRVNTLFAQNVDAASAELTITDPANPGFSHTETQVLVDNSGVTNIWRYLFAAVLRRTYVLFSGLPNYAGLVFELTLALPGGDAKCGDCVVARSTMLGTTQFGGEISIIDFGKKERDAFGRFSWREGAFASTGDFALNVLKGDTDMVARLFTEARAQRRVYVAYDGHAATIINGVVTTWRGVLSTPSHRVFNCTLESLAS